MRKALWYVRSKGVSEQEKRLTVNWEWLRGLMVFETIRKLTGDIYDRNEAPFPVPFEIRVEEETVAGLTRIRATVFVEENSEHPEQ